MESPVFMKKNFSFSFISISLSFLTQGADSVSQNHILSPYHIRVPVRKSFLPPISRLKHRLDLGG
jgi:hypothetical protein